MQRENINPLDEAEGYFELLKTRAGLESLDDCINTLITFERDPGRVKSEVAGTVPAIQKISGKSITSIRKLLSLLKLPENIKKALLDGKINLTSAYIFAANLDHPKLEEIFKKACKGKFTKDTLSRAFQVKKKIKTATPITKLLSLIAKAKNDLVKNNLQITPDDAQKLLNELNKLIQQIKITSADDN